MYTRHVFFTTTVTVICSPLGLWDVELDNYVDYNINQVMFMQLVCGFK